LAQAILAQGYGTHLLLCQLRLAALKTALAFSAPPLLPTQFKQREQHLRHSSPSMVARSVAYDGSSRTVHVAPASVVRASTHALASPATQSLSIQHASDSKEDFIKFIKKATISKETSEFGELYHFLLTCFIECDKDFDGRVSHEDFDEMVERAGALPRKWGFAPTSSEQFADIAQRQMFRNDQFKRINTSCSGYIAFDEWFNWAYTHICEKSRLLDITQARSKMHTSAPDFKQFVISACRSRQSPEYKELYHFLQDCFTKADRQRTGQVGPDEFDEMIEVAAEAPRKFGFAPSATQTYGSTEARKAARRQMFLSMDVDCSGFIAFDEWLNFSYEHIYGKVRQLDPTLPALKSSKLSIQHASDSREDFVEFIKNATRSKATHEFGELYHFLLTCFIECDKDFDGRISHEDFDEMVERAGALPRKWGFAPTSAEQFPDKAQRQMFRNAQFKDINTSGTGYVAFDEWFSWAYAHICEKTKLLDITQARSKMHTSAPDFKQFVISACRSRQSPEYKELYHFLQDCFTKADRQRTGGVGPDEFDEMIEVAADAPRKFGFAPSAAQTYESEQARKAARRQMFQTMDVDRSNIIAFDEWLTFCYQHICEKARQLDPTLR